MDTSMGNKDFIHIYVAKKPYSLNKLHWKYSFMKIYSMKAGRQSGLIYSIHRM